MTSGYVTVLFISICRIPFLAKTLDNADPLFALVITPDFHIDLQPVDVADQDTKLVSYNKLVAYNQRFGSEHQASVYNQIGTIIASFLLALLKIKETNCNKHTGECTNR